MTPLVLSIVAVLFSGLTFAFSFLAYAKVVGMEKSTHKVMYAPMPESEEYDTGKDLVKKLYGVDEDDL